MNGSMNGKMNGLLICLLSARNRRAALENGKAIIDLMNGLMNGFLNGLLSYPRAHALN